MPKRCGDPTCGNLIKKDVQPVQVGEKFFCDDECASNWQQQGDLFDRACDPFHEPMRPPPRRTIAAK